jgi:sugar lactone lactonase YvrE
MRSSSTRPIVAAAILSLALPLAAAAADRYTFTHLAGGPGGIGTRDGRGSAARFYEPTGLGVDRQGNIYVSDYGNHLIRKVTPEGDVTTLAGLARQMGFRDGRGSGARFHCPYSPTVDANGDIFLSDSDNHVIRRITQRGDVVTLAGDGREGSDNGTGSSARFDEPYGIDIDNGGNIIVADSENHTIRRITPTGVVTTIAGSPGQAGFADGNSSDARFRHPTDVAVASDGTIYVADEQNNVIRRIDTAGEVTTFAGSPGAGSDVDGVGPDARFDDPLGIAVDSAGTLYVADFAAHTIRRIARDRTVTTLAGLCGTPGSSDGRGSAARFRGPTSLKVTLGGSVVVADSLNDELRVVAQDGTVSTLAGLPADPAYADGVGAAARFDQPTGVAVDAAGRIAVSDSNNHVVRGVTFDGAVSLLAGSPGLRGNADGVDGAARFSFPAQLSYGIADELYVADYGNAEIRLISPAGLVTTMAGTGTTGAVDGPAITAQFSFPTSVTVGRRSGALYVADRNNHVIRRIKDGQVTTLAGTLGVAGAVDGPARSAKFNLPYGLVGDEDENLYVADFGNHTIRRIAADGTVTTIAGAAGAEGNVDGNAVEARFSFPASIAIDGQRSLFVTDSGTNTIRRISPNHDVFTIGGTAGVIGSSDGTASHAQFAAPYAIAMDSDGVLLVADRGNHAIRIGKAAAPDTAVIDAASGAVGTSRILGVETATGTSFRWTLVRKPSASSAEILDAESAVAHFTPDVADLYEFELTANGPEGMSITTVTLAAFDTSRRRAARSR